ncbi:MAG: hypothetical protein NDF52_01060 [archaeon YNP-WB-062]|nr:hypothetical protein [Candidatus Culexarchaeum yellowstonense]
MLIQPVGRKEFEERVFPYMYSYIVYKEGDKYYAKSGNTGVVEYIDIDASNVIQYAIDNSEFGQSIIIRTPKPWSTYKLSKPIVPKDGVAIIGEGNPVGVTPTYLQVGFSGGVVLEGDESFPCILKEDDSMNVRIENIGINKCSYGIKLGAYNKVVGGLVLRNIWIQKTKWGIYIINPYFNRFDFVRIINRDPNIERNGMYLASWHDVFEPGNSVFTDVYIDIGYNSTGLMLEGLGSGTGGVLGLLEFHRLQIMGLYGGASHGVWIKSTESMVHLVSFYDLDVEDSGMRSGGYAVRISGGQQIWIYAHLISADVLFENTPNFTGRYIYFISIDSNPNIIDNTGTPHGVFIATAYLYRDRISGTGNPVMFSLLDSQLYTAYINDLKNTGAGLGLTGHPTAYGDFNVNRDLYANRYIYYKLAGTVSVSAGSTSVTISYPLYVGDPSTYAIIVTPSWNTAVWVTKDTSSATVYFSNAPTTDATLDWVVIKRV